MSASLYIETTIPSYLTARPCRDLVISAHQQITRDWWQDRRDAFDLFVSQAVLDEAGAGDPQAAAERLAILREIPVLQVTEETIVLAERLCRDVPLPKTASVDALHVALAAVHATDYLLTWNCTHIANAILRPMIISICAASGRPCPVICTPLELLEAQT